MRVLERQFLNERPPLSIHLDLDKEVTQVLLESWDVVVEVKKSFHKHLHLTTTNVIHKNIHSSTLHECMIVEAVVSSPELNGPVMHMYSQSFQGCGCVMMCIQVHVGKYHHV